MAALTRKASHKLLWLRVWVTNSNQKVVGRWYLEYLYESQGCCLTGAQQPGAPKKVLWAPKFLQQLPKHYLLGSQLFGFCPSGLLEILLGNSLESRVMPSILRLDKGTETGIITTMHAFLRQCHGDMDPCDSVIYDPSTSNQVYVLSKLLNT